LESAFSFDWNDCSASVGNSVQLPSERVFSFAGIRTAGVFIQMGPNASEVPAELGIGIHTQRNNTPECPM